MVLFISLLYRRLGLCGTSVPYTDMLEEEADHDQEHRDNQGTEPYAVLRIRDVYPWSWFLPIPDLQKQQQKRGGKKLLSYLFM
jgi:hypothetical protein